MSSNQPFHLFNTLNGKKEKLELTQSSMVLEQLVSILGPRGIQHYVFLGALNLLENIANSYLNVFVLILQYLIIDLILLMHNTHIV